MTSIPPCASRQHSFILPGASNSLAPSQSEIHKNIDRGQNQSFEEIEKHNISKLKPVVPGGEKQITHGHEHDWSPSGDFQNFCAVPQHPNHEASRGSFVLRNTYLSHEGSPIFSSPAPKKRLLAAFGSDKENDGPKLEVSSRSVSGEIRRRYKESRIPNTTKIISRGRRTSFTALATLGHTNGGQTETSYTDQNAPSFPNRRRMRRKSHSEGSYDLGVLARLEQLSLHGSEKEVSLDKSKKCPVQNTLHDDQSAYDYSLSDETCSEKQADEVDDDKSVETLSSSFLEANKMVPGGDAQDLDDGIRHLKENQNQSSDDDYEPISSSEYVSSEETDSDLENESHRSSASPESTTINSSSMARKVLAKRETYADSRDSFQMSSFDSNASDVRNVSALNDDPSSPGSESDSETETDSSASPSHNRNVVSPLVRDLSRPIPVAYVVSPTISSPGSVDVVVVESVPSRLWSLSPSPKRSVLPMGKQSSQESTPTGYTVVVRPGPNTKIDAIERRDFSLSYPKKTLPSQGSFTDTSFKFTKTKIVETNADRDPSSPENTDLVDIGTAKENSSVRTRQKTASTGINGSPKQRVVPKPATTGHPSNCSINTPSDALKNSFLSLSAPKSNVSLHPHAPNFRWKLGSLIGTGSYGTVHLGINQSTGMLMAVKSMRIKHGAQKESFYGDIDDENGRVHELSEFQREIDVMSQLSHPNIVRYLGADVKQSRLSRKKRRGKKNRQTSDRQLTTKTKLFIFQEWVPGGSLTSLLRKFGAFSVSVLRTYLRQILQGLDYLHSNHIIHRDIKCGNILVDDRGCVKLADFGASKQLQVVQRRKSQEMPDDANECSALMCMTATLRGTPYFMAPEVYMERYNNKCDIWSVGGVVCQMATGDPPWKNLGYKNPMALFWHLKNSVGPPPPFHSIDDAATASGNVSESQSFCRKFPVTMHQFLEECFNRDPNERSDAKKLLEHAFFSAELQSESEPFSPATEATFETNSPRTPYSEQSSYTIWNGESSPEQLDFLRTHIKTEGLSTIQGQNTPSKMKSPSDFRSDSVVQTNKSKISSGIQIVKCGTRSETQRAFPATTEAEVARHNADFMSHEGRGDENKKQVLWGWVRVNKQTPGKMNTQSGVSAPLSAEQKRENGDKKSTPEHCYTTGGGNCANVPCIVNFAGSKTENDDDVLSPLTSSSGALTSQETGLPSTRIMIPENWPSWAQQRLSDQKKAFDTGQSAGENSAGDNTACMRFVTIEGREPVELLAIPFPSSDGARNPFGR